MPGCIAAWTLAVWWGIALVDILAPVTQRSEAPQASEVNRAYFRWILRIFALFQMGLIAPGECAVVHSYRPTAPGVACSVGFIAGSQGLAFSHALLQCKKL
jgi:hypothetical protein